MGCINNVGIKDKKYIIKSNQITNNEKKKKPSLETCGKIYSKKLYEEKHFTNTSPNVENMIENNPLPFVKIKMKKHHL